jgi:hypothetical protein
LNGGGTRNDLKKSIIKKNNTKKKKQQTTMVVLSNTVNTPPLGQLSLHHIEKRNRRTGTEEKLCK